MFGVAKNLYLCHTIYTFDMEKTKNKKTLRGVVVSTEMRDTVVVAVDRYVRHPIYGKYRRTTKRYKAHCPGDVSPLAGEQVVIESCRPISKEKRFRILSKSV